MSYEDYWYGDPWLIWDYIEADKFRQERFNQEAWLHGMYTYNALVSALSVSELFRGKGQKPTKYPDKPYELTKQEKTEDEKEKEAELERLRLVAYLDKVMESRKE